MTTHRIVAGWPNTTSPEWQAAMEALLLVADKTASISTSPIAGFAA
jgi:hypothetical protein